MTTDTTSAAGSSEDPLLAGIGELLISARSYDEYRAMFALTDADLAGSVLDCPAGAASFTAGARARGTEAWAVDRVYAGGEQALKALAAHAEDEVERWHEFVVARRDRYRWETYTSPEALRATREAASRQFAADVAEHPERYLAGELPVLGLPDRWVDLVLTSHLLFTYDDRFDAAFHVDSLAEMARVARREVRAYPLLGHAAGTRSPLVEPVREALEARGLATRVEHVGYDLPRGGDEMLVVAAAGTTTGRAGA